MQRRHLAKQPDLRAGRLPIARPVEDAVGTSVAGLQTHVLVGFPRQRLIPACTGARLDGQVTGSYASAGLATLA